MLLNLTIEKVSKVFVASSRSVSHIYSVSCFRTSNIVRLFQAGCTLSSHFLIYPGYTPRLAGSHGRHNARTHDTHIRDQEIGIESRKYMKKSFCQNSISSFSAMFCSKHLFFDKMLSPGLTLLTRIDGRCSGNKS